jgi:hypothetical protein
LYLQTRPYKQLSTENPIGTIAAGDIEKASGIVPRVHMGLVAWADGRSGEVAIMGYDLIVDSGEFLISQEKNGWQEGNPYVGYNAPQQSRWVVYDTVNTGVGGGDQGNIESSILPPAPTSEVTTAGRQLTPVTTNVGLNDRTSTLAWVNFTETPSDFPGYFNTEVFVRDAYNQADPPVEITAGVDAPRAALNAEGNYLVWQELRLDEVNFVSSWDVVVYDLTNPGASYFDGTAPGLNQIEPDVSGRLMVYTQEEDPAGTGATNVYFQDLQSGIGPLAVTVHGAARQPAISRAVVNEGEGDFETYFVVWQDHNTDPTQSFFAGGNGENDFNWDIWAQEIRLNTGTGEYELHLDPFLIWSADGRQTLPDIDGLDIVWQSQAPNVEDIYVWGPPIPEPATFLVLVMGGTALLARRRAKARRGR